MKRLIMFFMVLLPLHSAIAENIHCDSSIKIAVVDRYKNLSKYSDYGSLISANYKPKIFRTVFSRPSDFKLIFGVNTLNKTILNLDDKVTSTTFERQNGSADKFFDKNVKSMLDGGAGVTHSLSSIIPPLLFGYRTVWSSSTIPTTYELDTSTEGIAQCKIIFQYPSPTNTKKTYWVGPNMLINIVLIESNFRNRVKKTSINYHNIQVE